MWGRTKSALRLGRCGDMADRKIIHSDSSPDTRFISLPLFHLSSGVCLYGAWVCVSVCLCMCCHSLHSHTLTTQTCPCATFFFFICLITSSSTGLSVSGEGERGKKKDFTPWSRILSLATGCNPNLSASLVLPCWRRRVLLKWQTIPDSPAANYQANGGAEKVELWVTYDSQHLAMLRFLNVFIFINSGVLVRLLITAELSGVN